MDDVSRCWVYPTAQVSAQVEVGICFLSVRGVVTPRAGGLILAENARWLGECGARAQVVDYSRACLALDLDALLAALQGGRDISPSMHTPTALLANADQMTLFTSYARASADLGIVRAPFIGADDARRWAAAQAPAFAALQQAARRAGARPEAPRTRAASRDHPAPDQMPLPIRGPRG